MNDDFFRMKHRQNWLYNLIYITEYRKEIFYFFLEITTYCNTSILTTTINCEPSAKVNR